LGAAASASSVGVAWLDLTSFEQYVWFSFVGAVAATVAEGVCGSSPQEGFRRLSGRCLHETAPAWRPPVR